MTAAILSPFQALVKDFKYRLPLQKADLMVGIIPLWLTGLIPLWPPRGQANGQSIHWASDYSPATVQDMGVNHGGTDVGVSEKLLNCANIVAIFQQMGGKGMAHGVRAGWLPDAPLEPPIFDGLLEDRFMEVVSALFSSEPVDIMAGCREHPLPPPFFACVRVFSVQSVGQTDTTQAGLEILLMLAFHGLQMSEEGFFYCCGKHRVPVLVALSSPNDNLILTEVDIFDSQAATLHEPQPSTIQKHRH